VSNRYICKDILKINLIEYIVPKDIWFLSSSFVLCFLIFNNANHTTNDCKIFYCYKGGN
jgi:hypothetical protein